MRRMNRVEFNEKLGRLAADLLSPEQQLNFVALLNQVPELLLELTEDAWARLDLEALALLPQGAVPPADELEKMRQKWPRIGHKRLSFHEARLQAAG